MSSTQERYRYWREVRPELTASQALAWTRYEAKGLEMRARLSEWDIAPGPYGAFAAAMIDEPSPYVVRVLVGDDDQPVDWGCCEPTDEEREHASAFYVAVQVLDEAGDEVYHDGIGGVDVIDLPGYLQRDWEDAADYALIEYLYDGAMSFATHEATERAYWAARDVVTVG